MVKLIGPLLAAGASGTLARTIMYARTARGSIAKARGDRRDAKSPAQVSRRSLVRFLTQQWGSLNHESKQSWEALGEAFQTSAYHAYLKTNAANWHNFKAPGQIYPIERDDTAGIVMVFTAQWVQHRIKLVGANYWTANNWGICIFASRTSGFTCGIDNCIILELYDDMAPHTWWWTPPTEETWHINSRPFSEEGNLRINMGQVTAAK